MLLCSIQLQHSAEHAMMSSKYVRLDGRIATMARNSENGEQNGVNLEGIEGSDNMTHSVWAGERLADLDIAVPESS